MNRDPDIAPVAQRRSQQPGPPPTHSHHADCVTAHPALHHAIITTPNPSGEPGEGHTARN